MDSRIAVDEIVIPASADVPEANVLARALAVRNAVAEASIGGGVLDVTMDELLPVLQDRTYRRRRLYAGRIDDDIVGHGLLEWAADQPASAGWINGGVLPDWRSRGLGTALLARIGEAAREAGLTTCQVGAMHPQRAGADRLSPATGSGSVPASDPGVRFLRKHGFGLEQVVRISILDLPVEPGQLAAQRAGAEAVAGPDYRVHTWVSPTPAPWLDDIATLHARMATDPPRGTLVIEPEVWDAERVRVQEARAHQGGRRHLVAAVEYVPARDLVAFSGLSLPDDRTRPARQGPTLVLKEHRGHRLGMIVKTANLQQLAEVSPESRLMLAGNAEANRHMLAINEAIGYRAVAYNGIWKKTIA